MASGAARPSQLGTRSARAFATTAAGTSTAACPSGASATFPASHPPSLSLVVDRQTGSAQLDLMLHTPGGDLAATESLVRYLRAMFGTNIRAIVPQLAMSAGTMVACACNEILMGLHSSLGPIDPQLGGLPAHGIVEEFKKAAQEIKADPAKIPVWQPIIGKYTPTLIGEAQNAIKLAEDIVRDWLVTGMFAGKSRPGPKARANKVLKDLASHSKTLTHARHIGFHEADAIGLNVTAIEADNALQDAILTVHHLCIQTLADTAAMKLIENQHRVTWVQAVAIQVMPAAPIQSNPAKSKAPDG